MDPAAEGPAGLPLRPNGAGGGFDDYLLLQGLPINTTFPIFAKRDLLFHTQSVRLERGVLNCLYYERLATVGELRASMQTDRAIRAKGLHPNESVFHELSVTIFQSIYSAPDGRVPEPGPEEPMQGDHAVVPFYEEDGRVFFLSNWKRDGWGDSEGWGSLSFPYIERYLRECWALRFAPGPPSDPAGADLAAGLAPGGPALARLDVWGQEHALFGQVSRGENVGVWLRWLTNVGDGSLELQSVATVNAEEQPTIVGWLHLRVAADRVAVEELFVWPTYRERGIGTALAGVTLTTCFHLGLRERAVRWVADSADEAVAARAKRPPVQPRWLSDLLAVGERPLSESLIDIASANAADGIKLAQAVGGALGQSVDISVMRPFLGLPEQFSK